MTPSVRATTAKAEFDRDKVLGALRVNETLVGSPDVECCGFRRMVIGDTLCARGFRSGGRRKVLATTIAEGKRYVLVREGWYSWPACYVHVI